MKKLLVPVMLVAGSILAFSGLAAASGRGNDNSDQRCESGDNDADRCDDGDRWFRPTTTIVPPTTDPSSATTISTPPGPPTTAEPFPPVTDPPVLETTTAPPEPTTTAVPDNLPSTTAPVVTEPVTTLPPDTTPVTTAPVTTVPATTVPATTEPATTTTSVFTPPFAMSTMSPRAGQPVTFDASALECPPTVPCAYTWEWFFRSADGSTTFIGGQMGRTPTITYTFDNFAASKSAVTVLLTISQGRVAPVNRYQTTFVVSPL